MKIFYVCGWISGDDYDNQKAPDFMIPVRAADAGAAETAGEKKMPEKCEVIEAS